MGKKVIGRVKFLSFSSENQLLEHMYRIRSNEGPQNNRREEQVIRLNKYVEAENAEITAPKENKYRMKQVQLKGQVSANRQKRPAEPELH